MIHLFETTAKLKFLFFSVKQRESMGLLEYQAMPSLRDVDHDRWLCTFII